MIVGFSLTHVEADRKAAKQGNMNVNYSHSVTDVEEAEVNAFDESLARIHFSFTITYRQQEEDIATVSFDGNLLWQQDSDQVVAQWEEDESLDESVGTSVANHIFRKCLTQAVGLADSLELPSPVPMPKVQNQ